MGPTERAPGAEKAPSYKSYGEYAQQKAEEEAKNRPAAKGKVAPNAPTQTPKEPPKS